MRRLQTMTNRGVRFVAVAAVAVTALTATPAAAFGHKPRGTEAPRPTSPVPGFVLDTGRYTSIQVPGATGESLAGGLNNRGQIVGQYRDARGEHGYLRDAQGKLTTIDIPGALATAPVKINDRGQIVGIYSTNATNTKDPDATIHGFVLHRGKVTTIDYPGAASTQAAGINNRGEVVGDYFDAAGTAHGFRWYNGRFTRIDVPGTFTGVLDINDRGQIVGYHADNVAGPFHGFVLDRGKFMSFDAPGVRYTYASGIDNRGRIVGFTGTDAAGTELHGFRVDKRGRGTFESIDFPGAPSTIATDINDSGRIVGFYENPDASTDAGPDRQATRVSSDPPMRGRALVCSRALICVGSGVGVT
jgi:probable HAF family extracellular repeat protein/YD repeat-containing protein